MLCDICTIDYIYKMRSIFAETKPKSMPEEYCIKRKENGKITYLGWWKNLTISEANDILEELHGLECTRIGASVGPIITLRFTTKKPAFAVSKNGSHYTFLVYKNLFHRVGELIN